jgi:uncharacterized membrane protein YbaN (DUF454 family)
LGPPVKDWEKNGVINFKAKILATIMIGLVIIFQVQSLSIALMLKITIIVVLILVLAFIWSRPSLRE